MILVGGGSGELEALYILQSRTADQAVQILIELPRTGNHGECSVNQQIVPLQQGTPGSAHDAVSSG